jgi:hypothetical protein
MPGRRKKAKEDMVNRLWREYKLQTYFTVKGRTDYFALTEDDEKGEVPEHARDSTPISQPEKTLRNREDCEDVQRDLKE